MNLRSAILSTIAKEIDLAPKAIWFRLADDAPGASVEEVEATCKALAENGMLTAIVYPGDEVVPFGKTTYRLSDEVVAAMGVGVGKVSR
jgi:hypothetical protein